MSDKTLIFKGQTKVCKPANSSISTFFGTFSKKNKINGMCGGKSEPFVLREIFIMDYGREFFRVYLTDVFLPKNDKEKEVWMFLLKNKSKLPATGKSWKNPAKLLLKKEDLSEADIDSFLEIWREYSRTMQSKNIDERCREAREYLRYWFVAYRDADGREGYMDDILRKCTKK